MGCWQTHVVKRMPSLTAYLQSHVVIWMMQVTRCQLSAVGHIRSTTYCNIRIVIMVPSFFYFLKLYLAFVSFTLYILSYEIRKCTNHIISTTDKKEGPECCANPGPPLLGQVGGEILPRRWALGSPGLRSLFLKSKKTFLLLCHIFWCKSALLSTRSEGSPKS